VSGQVIDQNRSARTYVARNNAAASDNAIHSDPDVARRHGFAGGTLVPGLASLAFAADLAQDVLGNGWLDHGAITLSYQAPVYDGERLMVTFEGDVHQAQVSVLAADGTVRSRGSASAESSAAEDLPIFPLQPPQELLPLNEEGLLATNWLTSIELNPTLADVQDYFAAIGLPESRAAEAGCVPPAFLVRTYLQSTSATFKRLGPTVHTGSEMRQHRRVRYGESLSLRGRVDRLYARKGNRYVVTEFVWYDADERPVVSSRQYRIFRLRGARDERS
jgi:MaoC like domain/N-terminal half of MaoC dehydratase